MYVYHASHALTCRCAIEGHVWKGYLLAGVPAAHDACASKVTSKW